MKENRRGQALSTLLTFLKKSQTNPVRHTKFENITTNTE